MCLSPLTGTKNVTLLKKIPVEKIIRDWFRIYRIDITEEFHRHKEIWLYQCNETHLKFFLPYEIVGSGKLYEKLEKFDWYYMPDKWEHHAAIQDLKKGDRVIEIGCGYGEFLEYLRCEKQIDACGIELNSNAAVKAQQLGRPVKLMTLDEVAKLQSETFDVVCSFQVLEHIPDVNKFIDSCIDLLKPGGRLIICVPNSDGFIKFADNDLLNQPPHHLSLWSRSVFEKLPQYFPLELIRILTEPLALYHLDWFSNVQLNRLPQVWPLTGIAHRFVRVLLLPILRIMSWYKLLPGHSIYVCYQKINRRP